MLFYPNRYAETLQVDVVVSSGSAIYIQRCTHLALNIYYLNYSSSAITNVLCYGKDPFLFTCVTLGSAEAFMKNGEDHFLTLESTRLFCNVFFGGNSCCLLARV
ncbi:hypothetical protein LINPERHAP1_LOCUS6619 [Linum perenne]